MITGSRDWSNPFVIADAIDDALRPFFSLHRERSVEAIPVIVHGDAKGADYWADLYAKHKGYIPEPYPAQWSIYGKAAGPKRNQEMVDKGANLVLAFPKNKSVGTRDCIRKAEAAGLKVITYEGDKYDREQ